MCEACQFSKQTHSPFVSFLLKSTEFFELIHSDLWGPAPIDSYDRYKCLILFIDDRSRATWLYLLKTENTKIENGSVLCF